MTTVNVLIRGQSNARIFYDDGSSSLLNTIQTALSGDGVTVNLLGGDEISSFDGTSIIPNDYPNTNGSWLIPDPNNSGSYIPASSSNTSQIIYPYSTLDSYLSNLPEYDKIDSITGTVIPTIIIYMQNENDSLYGLYGQGGVISTSSWESAVMEDANQIRGALGLTAAQSPYLFVSDVPSLVDPSQSISQINQNDQSIKIGMQDLAGNSSFNAVIGARGGDENMDNTSSPSGVRIGVHMDPSDAAQFGERLGLSVANEISQIDGVTDYYPDWQGPEVTSSASVSNNTNSLTVNTSGYPGLSLQSIGSGSQASLGVGWSIEYDGSFTQATSAYVSGSQVFLTFDSPIQTDGSATLFYGYGIGRDIAGANTESGLTTAGGEGNAIYDGLGLPLYENATGMAVPASGSGSTYVTGPYGNETISASTGNVTVSGATESSNLLVYGNTGSMTFVGNGSSAVVYAGTGNNELLAGSGNNTLFSGSSGNNTVFGGNGYNTDVVEGQGNYDTIVQNSANLDFYAGSGSTNVYENSGPATVVAGTGNITVSSGTGYDLLGIISGLSGSSAGVTVSGFKGGTDQIALLNFGSNAVSEMLSSAQYIYGGIFLQAPNGTSVFLNGVSSLSSNSVVSF